MSNEKSSPGRSKPEIPPSINCPVCRSNHVPLHGELSDGVYATTCQNCGFFFKFSASHGVSKTVSFTVNGKAYTVGNEWPMTTTLNTYLRKTNISKGTKNSCFEGGCGVCMVVVTLYNSVQQETKEYAVNSCMMGLYSCDGMDITTIEGLGNPHTGLHAIQKRLAEKDGAQCGFCSSGQVMNMYGLMKSNDNDVTVQMIEDKFDANICRCTGYRPILEAMRTFATDAPPGERQLIDIEELDGKLCKKSGKACSGHCGEKGENGCSNQIPRSLHIVNADKQWFRPGNMKDLLRLLKQHRNHNYRLVQGNTGFGFFKDLAIDNFDILIDISKVMELYEVVMEPRIEIGANVSINQLQVIFSNSVSDPSRFWAPAFAEYFKYIANDSIRNLAGWAGNMMIKHEHKGFYSDIFLCLASVGATLKITDGNGSHQNYHLTQFLNLNMKGKVITSMILPHNADGNIYVRTFKRSLRLQLSGSDVNAGFRFKLDADNNFQVLDRPNIVLGGINPNFIHAHETENFLKGKQLGNPDVLKAALSHLETEVIPDSRGASPAYRKSLALSLFYKAVLDICKSKAVARYKSGGTPLSRVPMKATQDYDTDSKMWPVTEPMPKTSAKFLTSGVAEYIDDLNESVNELFGGVVISTIGSGQIDKIDPSEALALPGVKKFIQASDIPAGGKNSWRPPSIFGVPENEELLSSGVINRAGQPIGLILAEEEFLARRAAELVKVTYKNVKTPIITIEDAIAKESFFPNPPKPTKIGDAKAAIAKAPHKISGTISCGAQSQFYLENQISVCTPTDEGGMHIYASSQWLDGVVEVVSQILNIRQSNVTVEVKRLGGGFGGKISQNYLISGLAALGAYVTKRPVKLKLDTHTDMKITGKRPAYLIKYKAGSTDEGKLLGVQMDYYVDLGSNFVSFESEIAFMGHFDNAYHCENWLLTPYPVKTNRPTSAATRAPGSVPKTFAIESLMDHLAKSLDLDPLNVRKSNLYVKNQTDPAGRTLEYCNIKEVVKQLQDDINYQQRKADINRFNQENRWKKRGLALVPLRYPLGWRFGNFTTSVVIYHGDGSVAIAHGGIDMGQGINTKVIQAVAYEFGIPVSNIYCKNSSSVINANSFVTGGSVATELCVQSAIQAAQKIKARMDVVKKALVNPTWMQLVSVCRARQVSMTESVMSADVRDYTSLYNTYSAICAEAEIDVLTGQYQFRQVDMLYDCGKSTNPELDIGQCEGGFMMGLGYYTTEYVKLDQATGEMANDGTAYKPPLGKDLPLKFNFKFLKNAPNPVGILGAKAVAEPPTTLSCVTILAIKQAIAEARAELGNRDFFPLNAPATPEKIQQMCLNNVANYTYGQ